MDKINDFYNHFLIITNNFFSGTLGQVIFPVCNDEDCAEPEYKSFSTVIEEEDEDGNTW